MLRNVVPAESVSEYFVSRLALTAFGVHLAFFTGLVETTLPALPVVAFAGLMLLAQERRRET